MAKEKRVEFCGRSLSDPARQVNIVYPDEFPSLPPVSISPVLFADGEAHLIRHHDRATDILCTFGTNQVRWNADQDGGKAIVEANDVIGSFSPGKPRVDGDDAPEPLTADLRCDAKYGVIIPHEIARKAAIGDSEKTYEIRLRFRTDFFEVGNARIEYVRGVIRQIVGEVDVSTQYNKWPLRYSDQEDGILVCLPSLPIHPHDVARFNEWLNKYRGKKPKGWIVFTTYGLPHEEADRRQQWFCVRFPNKREYTVVRAFPLLTENRFLRTPRMEVLSEKKIAVVGCGSLGSKIAVNLAATGTNHFALLDPDVMGPENVVRHEVGYSGYGLPKILALRQRIYDVNQGTHGKVYALPYAFGAANVLVAVASVHQYLHDSDLVVDAAGVHGISRFLNDLCFDFGVPVITTTVTNGAWGGEIVRMIPGETACWLCWLAQYESQEPSTEPRPAPGIYTPGCNQPTFTGTTYEVGMVANLASWMAVETLLRKEPDRRDFRGDYIRWNARDATGNPLVNAEILPISKRDHCPWCNP